MVRHERRDMKDETTPHRLRLARASLELDWDAAHVRRLAEGLERKRRARRQRRLAMAGAAVGVVLIALALGRRPGRAPEGEPVAVKPRQAHGVAASGSPRLSPRPGPATIPAPEPGPPEGAPAPADEPVAAAADTPVLGLL